MIVVSFFYYFPAEAALIALAKNYIKGRGIEVQAEAYITESVLQNVLKVPCTMSHPGCLVSFFFLNP